MSPGWRSLNIGTRPFFWGMHEQPVFRKMGWYQNEQFPVTERIARRGFYVPSGLGLGDGPTGPGDRCRETSAEIGRVNVPGTPEIRRLTAEMLDEVVRDPSCRNGVHAQCPAWAGSPQVPLRRMSADPECYVGVALMDGRPAGVVSGAADAAKFSSRMLGSNACRRDYCEREFNMLRRPRMLWKWISGKLDRPPRANRVSGEVRPVLTAIVVDPGIQGHGIGRTLVAAFETVSAASRAFATYRLDTQIANTRGSALLSGPRLCGCGARGQTALSSFGICPYDTPRPFQACR